MSPFTPGSFLRDRWPVLALGAAGSAFLALMASVLGVNTAGSVVMGAFFALIVIAMLTWEYLRRKRFYAELCAALEGMEHAYYLTSLLRRPRFQDGQLLFDACSAIVAAAGADLAREREAAAGTRAFAELWTHEITTPLAAARLTLERMHGPDAWRCVGSWSAFPLPASGGSTALEQAIFPPTMPFARWGLLRCAGKPARSLPRCS